MHYNISQYKTLAQSAIMSYKNQIISVHINNILVKCFQLPVCPGYIIRLYNTSIMAVLLSQVLENT